MPSRSFRDYFSGDDQDEQSAYIVQLLPTRSQRGADDNLIDGVGEIVSRGDTDGGLFSFSPR